MKKYESLTLEEMKKIAEIGNRLGEYTYENADEYDRELSCIGLNLNWVMFNAAAFLNVNPEEITIKTWYRIGEPRINEYGCTYYSSYNFADDRPECGVSVIDEQWFNTISSRFFDIDGRGVYKIEGVRIGTGSDGEPLIYPTNWAEKTRIRSKTGILKAITK